MEKNVLTEEEIGARFTALEFALEVIYANWLSGMVLEASDALKIDIVNRMDRAYGPITADPVEIEQMQQSVARAKQIMERFVYKVGRRELEIRQRLSQGHPSQP